MAEDGAKVILVANLFLTNMRIESEISTKRLSMIMCGKKMRALTTTFNLVGTYDMSYDVLRNPILVFFNAQISKNNNRYRN